MANKTRVSICIDDLFAQSKANHPAFNKGKNGKTYCNVDIWENDQADQYGNDYSVSLYDKETKKATYVGNGKKYVAPSSKTDQNNNTSILDNIDDGLPF